MVPNVFANYIFKDFESNSCKGYWTVIFCLNPVTRFENSSYKGFSPERWLVRVPLSRYWQIIEVKTGATSVANSFDNLRGMHLDPQL